MSAQLMLNVMTVLFVFVLPAIWLIADAYQGNQKRSKHVIG